MGDEDNVVDFKPAAPAKRLISIRYYLKDVPLDTEEPAEFAGIGYLVNFGGFFGISEVFGDVPSTDFVLLVPAHRLVDIKTEAVQAIQ